MTDQERVDVQPSVVGTQDPLTSRGGGPAAADQHGSDTQGRFVDPQGLLLILGDTLDDLEAAKIAMANRLRALTTPEVIGDKGGSFGKGIPAGHPVAARLAGLLDALGTLEHQAELELKRTMRTHPLGPWVKRTVGVGEKQAARLLASIGDPTTRSTVSQLWAYCGYHVLHPGHGLNDTQCCPAGVDPSGDIGHGSSETQVPTAGVAPSRKRGQRANWNTKAKSRAWLCAEAAVKAGVRKTDEADDSEGYDVANRYAITPLGQVYLDARAKYLDAVHEHECKRCGPSGKPAPVGSPLGRAHQKARADRIVAKEILKEIWVEARRANSHTDPITSSPGEPHPVTPEAVAS